MHKLALKFTQKAIKNLSPTLLYGIAIFNFRTMMNVLQYRLRKKSILLTKRENCGNPRGILLLEAIIGSNAQGVS